MHDSFLEQLRDRSLEVSKESNADIVVLAGPISFFEYRAICDVVGSTSRPNVLLMLSTFGGDADSAFRIARTLQSRYSRFTLYVHSYCKSAGTLLALGADEIVMSKCGELGPLDIQLLHRDLAERTSGLTPTQALATLRNEVSIAFEDVFLHIRRRTRLASDTAAEVAGSIVSGLYSKIYDKLDPVRLGENDRAMLIARDYGDRLSAGRKLLKPKAIEKLIAGYPSHEFVIDFDEASELFRAVRRPTELEEALESLISDAVDSALFDDEEGSIIELLPTSDKDGHEDSSSHQDTSSASDASQGNGETIGSTHAQSEGAISETEQAAP